MAPEVKTFKNSKLPKLPEICFEPVGKGGWPPISTWIMIIELGVVNYAKVEAKMTNLEGNEVDVPGATDKGPVLSTQRTLKIINFGVPISFIFFLDFDSV
jgi:hypothetical protein